MSKSVLISIRPEWCKLIVDGKKTVEVRKTRPKLETPFKVYIYCTVGGVKRMQKDYLTECFERGKVIGEFVCDRIFDISVTEEGYDFDVTKMTGLKYEEMDYYLDHKAGYGWHISDLLIYVKPKEIWEFYNKERCPHNRGNRCTYKYPCYRAGQSKRCGEPIFRPPQSWCYVEELEGGMFE